MSAPLSRRARLVALVVCGLPRFALLLLLLAPPASGYIGPGSVLRSPSALDGVAGCARVAAACLVVLAPLALLLGPAWIAWYARSLAPRRRARRLTLVVGSTFPDPLAGRRSRAKLA
ncbi:MAG: hypothetical protein JNL90_08120 [Planctomycetes bacterium]|nr:hypothetical protein [Planctomycetota bacterium]